MPWLKNKNTVLLELEITDSGTVIGVSKPENEKLLPIPLQGNVSVETVDAFLKKRRIPDIRDGLKETRQQFPGYGYQKNQLSLSDQYWIQYNRNEKWDKLNFFTNQYSKEAGKAAFSPWEANKKLLKQPSPDFTTNGVLKKQWIQDETMKSRLIKTGSRLFGQDPISEVLTSMVLEKMNLLPFVKYDLIISGMQFCSICDNFITENTEFVPASQIYRTRKREGGTTRYQHLLDRCKEYGIQKASNYINTMIAIDFLCGNSDRNLGNFGFIRSAESGEISGFAPLFDSGNAFWPGKKRPDNPFEGLGLKALKQILPKLNVKALCDTEDMDKLIEAYPPITTRQKDAVKQKIARMTSLLKGEQKEIDSREDR